ncbi:MAG: hypothetical protein IJL77_05365, partial [Clostridia bacterium]|nr:hypothetical protein [Clostridia bacterium]
FPKTGVIKYGDVSSDGDWTAYGELKDGKLNELITFTADLKRFDLDPTDPENSDYFIDKKQVSYEEYRSESEGYESKNGLNDLHNSGETSEIFTVKACS